MFSEILTEIQNNRMPDLRALEKRFDFALTKKLGIIKLPSAFWMKDPKVNPRADHLFWAALLLRDREKIDLAVYVLSVEMERGRAGKDDMSGEAVSVKAGSLAMDLLDQVSDGNVRKKFEQELCILVPEWFAHKVRAGNE